MDFIEGSQLIIKAYEKQAEERAFTLYATKYAWMDESNYIPFETFFNPKKEDNRPVEEILQEVRETLNANQGRWAS